MSRTERLYQIDRMLHDRGTVPLESFLDELEISLATFKRDLDYLRDRLNAPIVWDRDAGGYRFDRQGPGDKFELPGLWFSASEIETLLTMQQLLGSLGPGLLTPHIEPLLTRLRLLLDREDMPVAAIEQRIRIHRQAARTYEPRFFGPIATAVLQRKRLVIDHYSRNRNETLRREISPQRLTHYRENWYVDSYCHLRHELRSFSLDAIQNVWLGTDKAKEVSEKQLKHVLDGGYGIFSGAELTWAELEFSPERSRWVRAEAWHPDQQGWMDAADRYHLKVPYSEPTELIMDILRHVPEVRIVSPDALRAAVSAKLTHGLQTI